MISPTNDIKHSRISLEDGTYRRLNNSIRITITFLKGKRSKEMVVDVSFLGRSIIEPGNALSDADYEKFTAYSSEASAELALVAYALYAYRVFAMLSKRGKDTLIQKLKCYHDDGIYIATEQSDLTVHRPGVKLPILSHASSTRLSFINGNFVFEPTSFAFGIRQSKKDHYGVYSVLGLTEYFWAVNNLAHFEEGFLFALNKLITHGASIKKQPSLQQEEKFCEEILDDYRNKRGDKI